MRELILKMSMSLDGLVSDLEGTGRWMIGSDPQSTAWSVAATENASLHIMGSRSFEVLAPFYPTATIPFAPAMNDIPKAVFSQRGASILRAADAVKDLPNGRSWAEAYVASGDLGEEIARLKASVGKPIVAHGGAVFARSLVALGLVDEFILGVQPIALGKGKALFSDLPAPRPLKLVSSTAFPGGTIGQVYRAA